MTGGVLEATPTPRTHAQDQQCRGGDGRLSVTPGPFEGARQRVYDTVVQADRKVVIAGSTVTGPDLNFYLARYNPDGSPDTSFGGDGVVFTDFGADRNDEARALLLRPDGKIVATASDYGAVRLWEGSTGRPIGRQFDQSHGVVRLEFSPGA